MTGLPQRMAEEAEEKENEEREAARIAERESRIVRFEVPFWSGYAIGTECLSEHPCPEGDLVGFSVIWAFGWQTKLSVKKGTGAIPDASCCPMCGMRIPFKEIRIVLQQAFSLETAMLTQRRKALQSEMDQYLYRWAT